MSIDTSGGRERGADDDREARTVAEAAPRTKERRRPPHSQYDVEPIRHFAIVVGKEDLQPMGECLSCGHIMALVVWKDEGSLGAVTHGLCALCRDAASEVRGPCSDERGCWCRQKQEASS